MPIRTYKLTGIGGGRASVRNQPRAGEFTASCGIDPDLAVSTFTSPSGMAFPAFYSKFSAGPVDTWVVALITNPKDTKTYAVLNNGKIVSYDYGLGSETLVGTVAGSYAAGACYYNNYIYVFGTGAGKDDVSRYGPLDSTPSIADGFWKTTLSKTGLSNSTYPSMRLANLPKHWGFAHIDDSLYFLDYAGGQGMVHRIHTKKTTYEGDTDDTTVPSAYNVLDLPFNRYPTCIASYGTSVAIGTVRSVGSQMNQGAAELFIWNPTNPTSYDLQISLPDPLVTALVTRDGLLHVFTGASYSGTQGGVRVSTYSGGDTTSEVCFIADGLPPMPGAVAVSGRRLLFGGYCTEPVESACVWAVNSMTRTSPNDVQNVATIGTQVAASDQYTTALAVHSLQAGSYVNQNVIAAAMSSGSFGIYRKTAFGSLQSRWDSPVINIGRKFSVNRIRFPFGSAVSAGTVIEPYVYYDDTTVTTLPVINNSSYPSKSKVIYRQEDLPETGTNYFFIRLTWSGTVATPVAFPIEIDIDVYDDERD